MYFHSCNSEDWRIVSPISPEDSIRGILPINSNGFSSDFGISKVGKYVSPLQRERFEQDTEPRKHIE